MTDPRSKDNPVGESGNRMGPLRHELRRMPARRMMYEKYRSSMIDTADPFELASKTKPAGWRGTIGMMMGAFAIDVQDDLQHAWGALLAARADPSFPADKLQEMEQLFYSWPVTRLPDGKELAFTPENVRALTAAWKDPMFKARCEIDYTEFFRDAYRRIVAIAARNRKAA